MANAALNGKMSVSYPDGFHEMSEAERGQLNFIEEGKGVCLSDPRRHMIVTTGFKRIGMLQKLLLGGKDLAKNMEAQIRKPMARYGYRLKGYSEKQLDGKAANGIMYTYTAQGVDMYAESYVVKSGDTLYYLHLYTRMALWAENQSVWDQILDSVAWAE